MGRSNYTHNTARPLPYSCLAVESCRKAEATTPYDDVDSHACPKRHDYKSLELWVRFLIASCLTTVGILTLVQLATAPGRRLWAHQACIRPSNAWSNRRCHQLLLRAPNLARDPNEGLIPSHQCHCHMPRQRRRLRLHRIRTAIQQR